MNRGVEKSFYVLMCGILGVLLFVILQQSLVLMHYVLLERNFQTFSLGLTPVDIQALGLISLVLAVFFGMWYGIWLGLYWYGRVYEQGEPVGLVHGFPKRIKPTLNTVKKAVDALPPRPFKPVVIPPGRNSKPTTLSKPVVKSAPKPAAPKLSPVPKSAPAPKPAVAKVEANPEPKITAPSKPAFWDFDDLLKSAEETVTKSKSKKTSSKSVRAVAKRAQRRTSRKVPSSIESV